VDVPNNIQTMKNLLFIFLFLFAALAVNTPAIAHGGTYIPPGDVVPPGGTGAQPPTPATPPTGAQPAGPTTPHQPNPASSSPPTVATPPTPAGQPQPGQSTSSSLPPPDLGAWVFWWELNKDHFLDLKTKVISGSVATDAGGAISGLGNGASIKLTLAPSRQQIEEVIVPALLQVLAEEDNRDLVSSAMIALARIGFQQEEVISGLRQRLQSSNQELRETAALALGILKDVRALPLLEALAQDDATGRALVDDSRVDLRTRVFAIYGLGLLGSANQDEKLQTHLANGLLRLLQEDKSALKDLRVAAVLALGHLHPPQVAPVVAALQALLEQDSLDQLVAAHLPHTIAHLLQRAPDDDPLLMETVTQFHAFLGSRRPARERLRSTVQALGVLAADHPSAPEAIQQQIYDDLMMVFQKGRDQQARAYASISLAYLGAKAPALRAEVLSALLHGMEKANTGLRPWCGLALGVLHFEATQDGASLPPLVTDALRSRFQETKAPDRRAAYAIALGLCGDQQAKPLLVAALADVRDNSFRGYTAVALGLLGAPDLSPTLTELVDDAKRDADLMRQGSIGLGLLGDRDAVERLVAILRPEQGRMPRLAVMAGVASALGYIGDRSAVEPLMDTLQDSQLTPLGRAFAVVALGMVADKDMMPWRALYAKDFNYRAAVSTLLDPASGTGLLDIL